MSKPGRKGAIEGDGMKETPTGIPVVVEDGESVIISELVRVEMFPELRKLSDARMVCKFFEYLAAKGIVFAALDAQDHFVDVHAELVKYLNIDHKQLAAEEAQLKALVAQRKSANPDGTVS
jgi:hypothetical protein